MTGDSSGTVEHGSGVRVAIRFLLWLPVPFLLWWALRGVSLRDVGLVLGGLSPIRLAALLALNLAFTAALVLRWAWILHGLGERITAGSLPGLAASRLAGFSISYLTPGPQIGGEPVQLALARKWTGLKYARGAASLIIDRSFDLAGNIAFIGLGLAALRSLPAFGTSAPAVSALLLTAGATLGILPLTYLASVFAGARPLARLAAKAPERWRRGARFARLSAFLLEAETEVAVYGRQPGRAAAQLILSFLVIQGLGVLEQGLALRFLGAPLGFGRTVLLLAGSKLALYTPVPGGLGALEAVQRTLLTLLGFGPETALALSAYVRLRDLLFALSGLMAVFIGSRRPRPRN